VVELREQLVGEGVVVPPADIGAVELLGDGYSIVETNLQVDSETGQN
jgi:hypothetical protein